MKKNYIVLFILFANNSLLAKKQPYIDSILKIVNTSKDIRTKIDALNDCAYEFRRGNKDLGKMFASQA